MTPTDQPIRNLSMRIRRQWQERERAKEGLRLIAHLQSIADAEGRFRIDRAGIARTLGMRCWSLDYQLSKLRIRGDYVSEGKARGRLTGQSPAALQVIAAREPDSDPIDPPSCSYPTCRAMGIEPVVHLLHHRTLGGDVGVGDIAITLARVPSLERPLT